MSGIDYEAPATAHYDDGRGEPDEFGPMTLARAVRTIMEQIPDAMRRNAWITLGARRIGIAEIEAIYNRPDFPKE